MMTALIQIPIMTAGIRPFGTKASKGKAYCSLNITTLTMTTMVSPMVKTLTMITTASSMLTKNWSVSGAKSNRLGTMTTMASWIGQTMIGTGMDEPTHRRTPVRVHWSRLGTTTTTVCVMISTRMMIQTACTMKMKSCYGRLDLAATRPILGTTTTLETAKVWPIHPIPTRALTSLTSMMTTTHEKTEISTFLKKDSTPILATMATSLAIGTTTMIASLMRTTNCRPVSNWVNMMVRIISSRRHCIWMPNSRSSSPVLCSH